MSYVCPICAQITDRLNALAFGPPCAPEDDRHLDRLDLLAKTVARLREVEAMVVDVLSVQAAGNAMEADELFMQECHRLGLQAKDIDE